MDANSKNRLLYLDWLRGIAGIIMLQGHVFNSFTKQQDRGGATYMLSQFVGGMPPAIFLFLTGITLALLMHSFDKKDLPGWKRWTGTLARARYLFAIAFLMRLQLWLFSLPGASWTTMLKVDILNCMGFAMAVMSVLAFFTTAQRIRIGAVLGLVIAGVSPLISMIDWSGVPPLVKNYLAPDFTYFSFFPWAAYLAFGISAGSLLRLLKADQLERVMQWAAVLGIAVIVTARYFTNLPYSIYPQSDFWLNSPAQVLIKLGVTLVLLAVAFLWTQYAASPGYSWVRMFGTHSLFVYWVHIELVYGRWLPWCKNNLDEAQSAVAALAVILLMLGLATVKHYRQEIWAKVGAGRWGYFPKPDRVPAD